MDDTNLLPTSAEDIPAEHVPTEEPAPVVRGRPFAPGQSGNPNGRPKGARNKATIAAEALLDGESEAIARKAIEKALEGDITALRLCLARVLPPRRDRPVAFELPNIATTADLREASSAVLAACAEGSLAPREAADVMALIATHLKTLELTEIEARLTALEKARQPEQGGGQP
jgi:hypothetical protein